jgi:hypothetical protein
VARIMVIGTMAKVELEGEFLDGGVVARCDEHSPSDSRVAPPGACAWTKTYDDWNDATEYAQDHADSGDQR